MSKNVFVEFDFGGPCSKPVTNGYLIFDFGVEPTSTPPTWNIPAGVTPSSWGQTPPPPVTWS